MAQNYNFQTRRNDRDVDLRSLGYYQIKQGILQQILSKCHRFERVETLCEYFNKFVKHVKEREQAELKESYLWLDSSEERKYITDREILDKYIKLVHALQKRKRKK